MPSRQGYDGMLLQTAHDRQNKVPYNHGVFTSYIVKIPKWEGCHADDDAHRAAVPSKVDTAISSSCAINGLVR
ncbi:hypothetical protein PspLS_03223 [Pyricularia sp. CBS 133598]|nr:hypothetical protein PspLS_03223 [Pyricularia sp. CBS 133598]